jgi:hemerythrin-like domain-containing protein
MPHDNELFRILVGQHREIDEMLTRLKSADDAMRRELCPRMRVNLLAHAKAEEKTFYAELARAGEQGEAKHAKREHREIEDALREIDSLDVADDRWPDVLSKLTDAVQHHVEEEESDVFAAARESISAAQLDEIAQRFEEQRQVELAALGAADDYDRRTKEELLELAREHEIEGRSQMSKDELIEALRRAS